MRAQAASPKGWRFNIHAMVEAYPQLYEELARDKGTHAKNVATPIGPSRNPTLEQSTILAE